MKNKWRYLIFAVCMLTGGLFFSYPVFCNRMYQKETRVQIQEFENRVSEKSTREMEQILEQARTYNQSLLRMQTVLTDPFLSDTSVREVGTDGTILDLDGTGQIGYLTIPSIDLNLPVYEGTDEEVLAKGIGRLEGSSLPVGGESTRTVLAGHTGLDSARLFTDLEDVREGDTFYLHVLDLTLAYRVSLIEVVLPEETDSLAIREGEDLCTLITCTPYGVNTHRFLVTGERIEEEEALVQTEHAGKENSFWSGKKKWFFCGAGLTAFLVGRGIRKRKKERMK